MTAALAGAALLTGAGWWIAFALQRRWQLSQQLKNVPLQTVAFCVLSLLSARIFALDDAPAALLILSGVIFLIGASSAFDLQVSAVPDALSFPLVALCFVWLAVGVDAPMTHLLWAGGLGLIMAVGTIGKGKSRPMIGGADLIVGVSAAITLGPQTLTALFGASVAGLAVAAGVWAANGAIRHIPFIPALCAGWLWAWPMV
ncbi:MAG: hypothetical protein ABJM18_06880 [Hyphomonas sp.]|uniref:hypothetical protein n=1 Tax=Hyphomonas sp. TaxID=87 RepID=UPI003297C848